MSGSSTSTPSSSHYVIEELDALVHPRPAHAIQGFSAYPKMCHPVHKKKIQAYC